MSLIRLHNVTMRYDDTIVLREAFFRVDPGERVGLIGKNGSGKTTLLKLILEHEDPSEGTVTLDPGVKIGYFSQHSTLDGTRTIAEVLDDLFADVHTVTAALAQIDAEMAAGPDGDALDRLINEQARLFEQMEVLDGWDYQRTIDTALSVLGFADEHRTMPIDQLSGGWRNRAALAKILLEGPDLLLLDEPTNFLDLAGVEWLEAWCRDFKGGAVIVSHDRQFLDATVSRMVEVENHHLHEYEGSFSEYIVQKTFRMKSLEKQYIHEASLLAYEAAGVASRKEAAKAGKGVNRKIANAKRGSTPKPVDEIITSLYGGLHVKDVLGHVEGISKAYGDNQLFSDISFEVRRRDRLAIIGANGSGKSTLLRCLTGDETPDTGEVRWPRGCDVVSYNDVLDTLDPNKSVSHAVNALPDSLALTAPKKLVHRFLEMLRFSKLDLQTKVGNLSGGQQARVAMAQCLLSGASTLILDEPTNHLDVTSAQVMERALVQFPGAVLVVSHDRYFIDAIATRTLVFANGEVTLSAA
jgi:ATPase subunit of ABC transporter with duplicated ATPase domains